MGDGGVATRYVFPSLRAPAAAQGPLWAPQLWIPPSFAQDARDDRELYEGINSQTLCPKIEEAAEVQGGTREES